MDPEKRRFFVIGYPRSRTAWLSVMLDGNGVRCMHEASMGNGVNGIKDAFKVWPEPVAGACEAALMFHVAELMSLYPDARWVMVHRDSRQALASMMADRPHEAAQWLERWPALDAAYSAAKDLLAAADCLHVEYRLIDNRAREIYRHCTGMCADLLRLEELQHLRIVQIPVRTKVISEADRFSAVQRLHGLGFNLSGLTVRPYDGARDALLFSEWAARDHGSGARLLSLLPPIGVVVEDSAGPSAMLWCREAYGVPAADLEFSVTRPGQSLKQSSAAMAFAVASCIELAGRLVVPPADYSVFRVTCRPSMGRFVKRLGFVPHGPDSCQKFIYQKSA